MIDHIIACVDALNKKFNHPGIFITGDFNSLATDFFRTRLNFKQTVKANTRGNKILDNIFTNLFDFYSEATILAPLGKSDHNCVLLRPNDSQPTPVGRRVVDHRAFTPAAYDNIAREIIAFNWSKMYMLDDSQEQANILYSVLLEAVNKYAPIKRLTFKTNDKPWISSHFKDLIDARNKEFVNGRSDEYKRLRNKVHRVSKQLQKKYYNQRIKNLKTTNNSKWWKEIKGICGLQQTSNYSIGNLTYRNEPITDNELPELVNEFLCSLTSEVAPLASSVMDQLRSELNVSNDGVVISEFEIYQALTTLKYQKASLSDAIPNKLLINLADILAAPIAAVVNSSIRTGCVPREWKISRVTLVPKVNPAFRVENDFRPISISCPIAGVAERIISRHFDDHFTFHQDPNQFGVTKDRSTVLALVKLCHILFTASDDCCNYIRILFIDFTKAFDLIDHNVLLSKFVDYEFPLWLKTWSLSFLHERSQFVKTGDITSSARTINAGAPQGTRAGGNSFKLLINDLDSSIHCIKYVDDVTIATVSSDPFDGRMQSAFEELTEWVHVNKLILNAKKTKEMVLCFGKSIDKNVIPMLTVGDYKIDRVEEFKLLGVVFRSDLNWSSHVKYILAKASRRIFVITKLLRSGMSTADVLNVYSSVVRSVLEYASPVWHCGLTQTQSFDIEKVQRRCFKIIFPALSYKETLKISGFETLAARRERASRELFLQVKHPLHSLYSLLKLKEKVENGVSTRDTYPFVIPRSKTNRLAKSLITYGLQNKW